MAPRKTRIGIGADQVGGDVIAKGQGIRPGFRQVLWVARANGGAESLSLVRAACEDGKYDVVAAHGVPRQREPGHELRFEVSLREVDTETLL